MKKALLWGIVIFSIVGFLGCPPEPSDPNLQEPITPTGWTTGIGNFTVETGDLAGDIKYSFTPTTPAADSYTLYYVEGSKEKSEDIIAADNSVPVFATESAITISGTVYGLTPNKTYSVVIVAKKSGIADATSAVQQARSKDGTVPVDDPEKVTLRVTDIPASANILGISLLNEKFEPVAASMNVGGVFALYTFTGEGDLPIDFTKPWTTAGSYYIALADSMTGTGTNYMYTAGGEAAVLYDIALGMSVIAWNQISIIGQEGPDTITLTVSGIPSDVTIASGILFSVMPTGPSDLGGLAGMTTNEDGTFTFANATLGEYFVVLATEALGQGSQYYYSSNGTPVKYDFSSGSGSIAWSAFTSAGNIGTGDDEITLTISGIPGETTIVAGVLLSKLSEDPDDRVGMAANKDGTFVFENIDLDEYFIVLATSSTGEGPRYYYADGGATPAAYDFSEDDGESTIPWSDFALDPTSVPNEDALKLTITGDIPSSVNIVSLMKDGDSVAAGMIVSGVVSFLTPNFVDPYTTIGSYGILAMEVDLSTQTPKKIYTYTADSGSYTFTSENGSVAWTDFTLTSGGEEEGDKAQIALMITGANGAGITTVMLFDGMPSQTNTTPVATSTTPVQGAYIFEVDEDDTYSFYVVAMVGTTQYMLETEVTFGTIPQSPVPTGMAVWTNFTAVGGGTDPVQGDLEGTWSTEDSSKSFTIETGGSFSATVPAGPTTMNITGTLTYDDDTDDYTMTGMGGIAAGFNGTHVQITFSDEDTFVLACSANTTVDGYFGGTFIRQQEVNELIDGVLEGTWSTEGASPKTFVIGADGSFSTPIMTMTITGKLTYDDATKDYIMSDIEGAGAMGSMFNNKHVQITFTDEDTFTLSSEDTTIQSQMGGTFIRQN